MPSAPTHPSARDAGAFAAGCRPWPANGRRGGTGRVVRGLRQRIARSPCLTPCLTRGSRRYELSGMAIRRGTYSIVARDADTGELGVAAQSHWFSVGSVVPWAEPGVGAVATQSIAEPAYGPRRLGLH